MLSRWNIFALVAVLWVFVVFGCDDASSIAGSTDIDPPENPIEVHGVAIDAGALIFTTINTNAEPIVVTIDFDAINAKYFVNEEQIAPSALDQSVSFTLDQSNSDASRKRIAIEASITNDSAPIVRLHTSDGVSNQHDEVTLISFAPDLTINTITLPDSTDLVAGQEFSFRVEIENKGYVDARSPMVLTYYKSSDREIDSRDQAVGTQIVAPLSARAKVVYNDTDIPVPDDNGSHYYGACIAPTDFSDANPSDNCSVLAAIIDNEDITPAPRIQLTLDQNILIGDTGMPLTIDVTVTNSGNADASADTQLRLVRSDSSSIQAINAQQSAIKIGKIVAKDGGEAKTSLATPAHSTPGIYYYGVCATYSPSLASSSVDICSSAVTIAISLVLPPVRITVGVGQSRLNGDLRSDLAFEATVINAGEIASDINTKFHLVRSTSETIKSTDMEKSSFVIGAVLGNGGTVNRVVSVPQDGHSAPGTYYYGVCASYTLAGASELTYACSPAVTVNIAPTPHLQITGITDAKGVAKSSFLIGSNIPTNITVAFVNNGEIATSTDTKVRLVRSMSEVIRPTGSEQTSIIAGAILANDVTVNKSLTIPAHSDVGTYYYGVCVTYTLPSASSSTDVCSSAFSVEVNPLIGLQWSGGFSIPSFADYDFSEVTYGENKFSAKIRVQSLIGIVVNYKYECDIEYAPIGYNTSNCKGSIGTEQRRIAGSFKYGILAPDSDGNARINLKKRKQTGNPFGFVSDEALTPGGLTLTATADGTPLPAPPSPQLTVTLGQPALSGITDMELTLSATLTNGGTAAAPAATELRLVRSTTASIQAGDPEQSKVTAGAVAAADGSVSKSFTIPAHSDAGTYYYGVCATYVISAASGAVNVCSSAVTVTISESTPLPAPKVPQLTVTLGQPALSGITDMELILSATLTNSGTAAAPAATELRLVRSTTASIQAGNPEQSKVTAGAVAAANGSVSKSFTIPAHSGAGTYYYGVCATYTLPSVSEKTDVCSSAVMVTITAPPNPLFGASWSGTRSTKILFFTYTLSNANYTASTFSATLKISSEALPYNYVCDISYNLSGKSYTTSNCQGSNRIRVGEVQGTFTYNLADHSDGDSDVEDKLTLSKGYVLTR